MITPTTALPGSLDSKSGATQSQLRQLLDLLVEERPDPLRRYDQIHMNLDDLAGHMLRIAPAMANRDVFVMGDSDGLVVGFSCAAKLGLIPSPRRILFCDFDRRVVRYVRSTARRWRADSLLATFVYNVFDPLPDAAIRSSDFFHTNPPYGQFNEGRSVIAFLERCVGALRPQGSGVVITANDTAYPWTLGVLESILRTVPSLGLSPRRIEDRCHRYSLDDQPDLRSGVIWCDAPRPTPNYLYLGLPTEFVDSFYGRHTIPIPRYISLDGEPEQLLLDV